jgi:imidazolonepropionase-like amidohydrolase
MSDTRYTLLKAKRLFDGSGVSLTEDAALLMHNGIVDAIGPQADIEIPDNVTIDEIEYGDATLLPGLVDAHTHLVAPGDGTPGDELAKDGDDILLMRAAKNARSALFAGVTTLRDNGSKNCVAFSLRKCVERDLTPAPRLNICGRPLTITGGHMWYFGSEADGTEAVRSEVRKLVKEGADYIKIVATGGSTRSSFPYLPSYTLEELCAITDEAHRFQKLTAAHCVSSQAISFCLDANVDMIIHCQFREPDGRYSFRKDLAERIISAGVWVNPTLHVGKATVMKYEDKRALSGLSEVEERQLQALKRILEEQMESTRRLIAMGAKIIAGSDSPWMYYAPGGFAHEIQALADAGMSNSDALISGTSTAAIAIGLGDVAGHLKPGGPADIMVVRKNPFDELSALFNVLDVYKDGEPVARGAS